jgi:4-coumarate--CoA ligase
MIILLCKHPAAAKADLSSVKFTMTGAAPLTKETMEAIRARMPHTAIGQGCASRRCASARD